MPCLKGALPLGSLVRPSSHLVMPRRCIISRKATAPASLPTLSSRDSTVIDLLKLGRKRGRVIGSPIA